MDNVGIAQGQGMPQIDQALEAVVGAIDALTEPQDGGPGVVLTLGGLVVSGTIIPAWQWFGEVERSARAAFVVHVGGPSTTSMVVGPGCLRVLPSQWRTTTWRGRLSEISGWSFGHLGVEPPTAAAQDADHYM
jgi:hypothetical protein